ncbi:MAG TPA: hypothetical protein VII52_04095, partial [Gemmatimonadaceae bacterium]
MTIQKFNVAAAVALLGLVACSEHSSNRAASDSSLARDLALAGQQTAQPTFQDTTIAPTPAPAAHTNRDDQTPIRSRVARNPRNRAPQPVPPSPSPEPVPAPQVQLAGPTPAVIHGVIGAGTGVGLTSGTKVCTSTNLPGDKLAATVNESITGSNGAVIPAGSTVVLEVASSTAGQNPDPAHIAFRVRSVVVNDKTYDVTGDVTTVTPVEKTKVAGTDISDNKGKVIGGAIVGALLGQFIGHNTKGTVIGAAAGAAT